MPNDDTSIRSRFVIGLIFALLFAYIYFVALRKFYGFNADHAVQIMMAYYWNWQSKDFYYWGQNRLGSLIPLLLVFPVKVLRLPPLLCGVVCSLAFYLIALVLLFRLARDWAERTAAMLWFFLVPVDCYLFLAYTGHPFAPTMALSLAAFAFALSAPPRWLRLAPAGFFLSIACWVSEAAVVSIVAILWLLWERRQQWNLRLSHLAVFLVACASMAPLIYYWRAHIGYLGHEADYVKIATPQMLLLGFQKFLPQFTRMVGNELMPLPALAWAMGACLLVVNLLVLFVSPSSVGEAPRDRGTPILRFLAMHNCLYVAVVLLSRHAYFGAGEIQRYWIPVIIYSGYMVFVLAARWLAVRPCILSSRVFTVIPAALLAGMTILNIAKWPKPEAFRNIHHKWSDLEWIQARGATRVTGNYWEALPLNVLSNFKVLAVPRDFARTEQFRSRFSVQERHDHPEMFFDFGPSYQLGSVIRFGKGGASEGFRTSGWGGTEEQMTRMQANTAALNFSGLPASQPLILKVTMAKVIKDPELPAQTVEVCANGKKIADWQVGTKNEYTASIPSDTVNDSGKLTLEFRLPKATTPKSPGINEDSRVLGVSVYELVIYNATLS